MTSYIVLVVALRAWRRDGDRFAANHRSRRAEIVRLTGALAALAVRPGGHEQRNKLREGSQ